ncbi:MAG: hypothetical protein INR67_15625, partial [Jatrophihabitans endophyticus]|nr:hypothetical protein [Jatrophihabitans endophyticus]
MNEDGEQSQPAGTSRGALAASTLRALRASRGSAPAADEQAPAASTEAPVEDETAATDTVSLAKPEPAEDEPTIVVLTGQPVQPVQPEQIEQPEQPTDELATDEPAAPGVPRRGRALTAACAVLAAAALVFAVVAGVIWWTAGHSGQHKLGVARVQVRKDAKLAIVTVNTS